MAGGSAPTFFCLRLLLRHGASGVLPSATSRSSVARSLGRRTGMPRYSACGFDTLICGMRESYELVKTLGPAAATGWRQKPESLWRPTPAIRSRAIRHHGDLRGVSSRELDGQRLTYIGCFAHCAALLSCRSRIRSCYQAQWKCFHCALPFIAGQRECSRQWCPCSCGACAAECGSRARRALPPSIPGPG
jgi:hypothetical protein